MQQPRHHRNGCKGCRSGKGSSTDRSGAGEGKGREGKGGASKGGNLKPSKQHYQNWNPLNALQLLNEMQQKGLEASVRTYNAAITFCVSLF